MTYHHRDHRVVDEAVSYADGMEDHAQGFFSYPHDYSLGNGPVGPYAMATPSGRGYAQCQPNQQMYSAYDQHAQLSNLQPHVPKMKPVSRFINEQYMSQHKFQPTTQQQHSVFPDRNNQTTSFTNSLDNAPSIWPRDTVDLQTLSPRPINRYTSDPRHHNASQYQYMQARSGLSVSAQAQYGDLVHGHLPQMPVQQPAFVQGGLDQQHAYSIQASQMSQTTALRPATAFHVNSAKESSGQAASGPSDKGQKAAKSIKSSSKRRYTPAELRIITTMMQAKATSEQIGQRLGRNPNSILLKWGRMQGRYADPHAAAKRRRTGKGGQP